MGFAPIPAVTEPPKSLGLPTVVLVQRTSNNPVGAPDHLTSSVSEFLTFPRAFYPSRRHYNSSEIRKCGSSYNNLLLLKSKAELNIYRLEHNIRVQSIIITNHGRQKLLPKKQ
jgi:phage baseplate assembly protein W